MANQVPAKISLSTVFTREYHTSFQETRGETSFLYFASYGALADVLQNTYHMLLTRRYSRSYLSSSGMRSTCGPSHDWTTRGARRARFVVAPTFSTFFEIVEDDVGAVCDPYHCRMPSYTPPYGSVKTYTGHRPRIIFRSRTRMTDVRACRVFYSDVRGG